MPKFKISRSILLEIDKRGMINIAQMNIQTSAKREQKQKKEE